MMRNSNQNNKYNKLIFFCLVVLLISSAGFAQSLEDALGFTETVNDVPEAPIGMLVSLAAIIGGYIGIKKLKA